jgi:uncharacterized membrane protein
MTRLFSIKPSLTLKGREFRGLRGWAGKPSHPPLTDFPIVCYILAAIFDVISYVAPSGSVARDFFVSGTYIIIAGAIVSLGTALTGFWDWWKGMERESSTGFPGKAKHTQVWRTANWHMVVMLPLLESSLRILSYVFYSSTSPCQLFDDDTLDRCRGTDFLWRDLWGSLVYDYQFNVENLDGSTAWDETEKDQMPADKAQRH